LGRAVVVLAALFVVYALSDAPLWMLDPRDWDDLGAGLADGSQALGTVLLPYAAADVWPRIVLELLGSGLMLAAALLALWPRREERGLPFIALAVLLILVVSPVVSLGGTRTVAFGMVLAALCVCFLWLERLPLRPGIGVAVLLGVALAGALPLAAAADRDDPWFDYKAFAEGLGPDDPIAFKWNQEYGPIDWPRNGNEVLRVKSDQPYYWKAANLEGFDGLSWVQRAPGTVHERTTDDVPEDYRDRPGWSSLISVSVRRLESQAVVGAGTIMDVQASSRPLRPSGLPGTFESVPALRRGDSYSLQVHVPRPTAVALRASQTGRRGRQLDDLRIQMPLRLGREISLNRLGRPGLGTVNRAVLRVYPYGDPRPAFLEFPEVGGAIYSIDSVMGRTMYGRTWRLAQRLKRGTESPFEYILAVNRYLQDLSYSERPEAAPPERAPLDAFLFDTKEGYCQHFSGAMALLLRMGGVPARVAAGFSPGGFSKRRDAWIVRDTDAHAWVEAWFDQVGWVTYDPTPAATPARSQIAALEDTPEDAATDSGADAVGGSGGDPNRGLRPELLRTDPVVNPDAGDSGGPPWWGWTLAGLGVAALLLWIVARLRRRLDGRSALERALAELEAALRRAGRPAPPGTTLRQLERRLGGSPEATAYLRALREARYGSRTAPPTRRERRALRRALAGGLGLTGRLRAWWALPPRM
jgi:transglutaminase-like putative cysteine protease